MKTFHPFSWTDNIFQYIAIITITIFASLILGSHTVKAISSVPDIKVVDQFLHNEITTYRIPGLAIAIVSNGEVIFTSGYGEASTGVKVTPNTPFLLGSTTKMFTALAVMRLVELGKVELDAPVKRYLPELQLKITESEDKITVRHLLNHTSGLSDKGMPGTTFGEKSLEREIVALRQCIPYALPGEKYTYFNINYRLLGLMIERVSGMRFGEFLKKEIFNPLFMTSTFAGPEGVKELAAGHGQLFGFPYQREQKYRQGALPSGYLVSSASDISRFLIAELKAGSGNQGILNSEIVKTTWSPPKNANEGYAMGWLAVNDSAGGRVLLHGGSLENYLSFFYLNPQRQLGFALLVNQGGLLPTLSFNTVRDGLLNILNEKQPENGPGQWPVVVVSGIFVFFLGIEIFRTIRLKTWKFWIERHKSWRQWFNVSIDLIWSSFLLFGLTPFMNALMGDKADWAMIYNLVPELFLLLIISICLGFLRGFIKLWILLSRWQKGHQYLFPTLLG